MIRRTSWIVSTLAVIAVGTLGGLALTHGNRVRSSSVSAPSPIKQTATKVSTQPPLDNGPFQPANPKTVTELTSATVEDSNGRAAPIATDKPTIFFAYWCGHCHEAIMQLESLGYANKFEYVSSLLEYEQGNTNLNIKRAVQLTGASFIKMGIKEPANVLYAMPGTQADKALSHQLVPFLLVHTSHGWYSMTGVPADESVWLEVLKYNAS